MIWAIGISLIFGAVVTSLIEYKLDYNLVDEIIDLFRSAESKAVKLEERIQSLKARL